MSDDREVLEQYIVVFDAMTDKQHEVLGLVADNFTSKEIAFELGVSESAVNQRIEAVRSRTGSPPRSELARVYRKYRLELEEEGQLEDRRLDREKFTGKITQLPLRVRKPQFAYQDNGIRITAQGPAVAFEQPSPKTSQAVTDGKIVVPEVLDGKNAGLSRIAAIVVIAGGMLLVAIIGLGVLKALSDLV